MAIKRARLGAVTLDVVESEEPVFTNEITEFPVERGQDVADHVKNKPRTLSITGVCSGKDAPKKLEAIRKYWTTRTLLKYFGRNIFQNCVIANLSTIHTKEVADGFRFTITLQEVRIAISKQVPFTKKDPVTNKPTKHQTKPVTSKGRVQPQKRSKNKKIEVEMEARKNRKTVYDGIG
jgi:adenine specific DNA methylase Mod